MFKIVFQKLCVKTDSGVSPYQYLSSLNYRVSHNHLTGGERLPPPLGLTHGVGNGEATSN